MTLALVLVGWAVALAALTLLIRRWADQRRMQALVFEPGAAPPAPAEEAGGLRRWLALAGYRDPGAPALFVGLTAAAAAVGLLATWSLSRSDLTHRGVAALERWPGGAGDLLVPVVYLAPWLAFALPAALPWLLVRRARRRRAVLLERDLPIMLELLATLAEAGLGFDAALDRILATRPARRPLMEEFRTFQLEVLAGRPRIECLRRLAARAEVVPLTVLVSALVQAEQVGAGVASVLRHQAEDLRARRREEALLKAAALPVKLVFPLVLCFLPGILAYTLGPIFSQFFQLFDGLIRFRGAP